MPSELQSSGTVRRGYDPAVAQRDLVGLPTAQEMRGDKSAPRIAFLEGTIEIASPSRTHEEIKSLIGRLVEVWCLEKDIDFQTLGSWTLEEKEVERGVEPDECYVFSTGKTGTRPDLAIEVVWTSGGLNKLDIYRKLGVQEVWFWKRGAITMHVLRQDSYEQVSASVALPGIDVVQLAAFLDRPSTSQAMRDYRAQLRERVAEARSFALKRTILGSH